MIRRFAQLLIGLFLYGIAISMMVQAAIGIDPWDVLTQGVSRLTGVPFGWLTNIIGGIAFLLAAYFLGRLLQRWVSRLFGRGDRVDLGGLLGSIVFDHFGLMGVPVHPVSVIRIAGAMLLVGGVVLIRM